MDAVLMQVSRGLLLMIADAPWYVPDTVIRTDLQTPTFNKKPVNTALNTVLTSAANDLVVNLMA
jgi:hypothetical protein